VALAVSPKRGAIPQIDDFANKIDEKGHFCESVGTGAPLAKKRAAGAIAPPAFICIDN
jgi:hypothetical protein